MPAGIDIAANPQRFEIPGEPLVFRGTFENLEAKEQGMREEGYSMIGYSHFNVGNVDES